MILFHGSNMEIADIDLDKCKPYKDFDSTESNTDCKYDIVRGPVADDAIASTIRRFMGDSLDEEGLMRKLTYKQLNDQYSFHTKKAIACLRKVGVLNE